MLPEELLSAFRAPAELPSNFSTAMDFHQISVLLGDNPLNSVNFLCGRETFWQLLSAFPAAGTHSINFRKLSVQLGDLH